MLAAACTAGAGDADRRSTAASTRFSNAYFNVLFAEHCGADRSDALAEALRLHWRLSDVRRRATAAGMRDDMEAAERRWSDFAARAEFVCEPGSADRLNERIDELVRIIEPPTPAAR